MSHFIQDNQAVVKTMDGKVMLLLKGGDNNVSSGASNKRCTSWSIAGVYESEEDYKTFIEIIMLGGVSGGSWQFNSLKNKSFKGFTEYENIVFNRFNKALDNAVELHWKISDVNTSNVHLFKKELENSLEANKFTLNNQDGINVGLRYFIYSWDSKEASPEENALKDLKVKKFEKPTDGKYEKFCKTYAKSEKKDIVNDVVFCRSFVNFDKTWSGSIDFLSSIDDMMIASSVKFSSFNILTMGNKKAVKQLLSSWESDIERLLERHPENLQTLVGLSKFFEMASEVIKEESEIEKYNSVEKFEKNLKTIVNANYRELIDAKKREILEIEDKSKDKFVSLWNDLIENSWYKNTNQKLPNNLNVLNQLFSYKTFSLEEIENSCCDNFDKIIYNHQNQMKKNKKAIKDVFEVLIREYTQLFSDKSILALCEYFGYEKPKVEKIEVVEKQEPKKSVEKPKGEQLTLFDFVA